MRDKRPPGLTKVTKVKGHGTGGVVVSEQARALDEAGNNRADDAADFGRRSVSVRVMDSRHQFAGLCGLWYPVVASLHRLFIAVSYLELLILYELWAGERPMCEKSFPRISRSGRNMSVSAAAVNCGVEIGKSCRFLGYVCALS